MFDKLIESDTTGAEFKNRRSYFLVSSVVVGILFLSAVVFSIYAADISLGTDEFELSTLIAPTIPEVVPEPPKPETPNPSAVEENELPSRPSNMLQTDEIPTEITPISVTPNTEKARPDGRFEIKAGPPTDGSSLPGSGRSQDGDSIGSEIAHSDPSNGYEVKPVLPPPVNSSAEKKVIRTSGPINGKATSLPKPPYPAPAIAIGLSGSVDVQVTIDETGKVISAKAVSGHPFLRGAAEKAAWKARFSPTYLGPTAVKVTGVIVYKFSRN
jgi:periplasmic protein TonB